MFTKEFNKILNLTEDESSVLLALKGGSMSMTDLASTTKIARTTLYTTVKTLKQRTLVEKYKIKNKTMIVLVDKSKIDSVLFSESTLAGDDTDGLLKQPDGKILYGMKNLMLVYEKIVSLKNQRVCVIQPTSSILAALNKVKPEKFVELNELIKKNKIIFDVINHKNSLSKYLDWYVGQENYKTIQRTLLESFEKRMSNTSLIEDEYLNVGSEIFFTDRELHILNWDDEIAVSIHNKEIIALISGLFNFAKHHSVNVNYHELIAKHLERVKG